MNKVHKRGRVPGSLFFVVPLLLAACDAPMAPTAAEPALPPAAPTAFAKKLDVQPAAIPQCPTPYDEGRVLCFADVNVKHGNASGLPVNLTGVRNGKNNGAELPVSVLGTLEFDLSKVDLGSLRLGDVETNPPETPLTQLSNGKYQASIVDLNGDGILDLMLHFNLATMVANGDISETTTKLCLYGEGPGYVLNGCGIGGGGEPPPPELDYRNLPDCDFTPAKAPARGYRCAVIELYGRDKPEPASVLQIGAWYVVDANAVYPNWLNLPETSLTGWESANLPLASQDPYAREQTTYDVNGNGTYEPFLTECGLEENPFRWASFGNILVRKDIEIPQAATNVRIEFLVDDLARVYLNGTNLTGMGRGDGWESSGFVDRCVSYASTITYQVPQSLIVGGGVNKLGVWAWDYGQYVNFLDFRVFADVPIS